MVSTNYLICYDITEDATRTAVADVCKSSGLVRIQYSVYYGLLSSSQLRDIKLEIESIIQDTNSNVHFLKVCQSCEKNHSVLVSVSLLQLDDSDSSSTPQYYQDESLYEEIRDEIEFDKGVLVL